MNSEDDFESGTWRQIEEDSSEAYLIPSMNEARNKSMNAASVSVFAGRGPLSAADIQFPIFPGQDEEIDSYAEPGSASFSNQVYVVDSEDDIEFIGQSRVKETTIKHSKLANFGGDRPMTALPSLSDSLMFLKQRMEFSKLEQEEAIREEQARVLARIQLVEQLHQVNNQLTEARTRLDRLQTNS